MDWIKKNYERVVLGFFSAALLACAGWVSWQARAFPASLPDRKSEKAPDNKIVLPDIAAVEAAAAVLEGPRPWAGYEGSLFVSRPYVLVDGKLVNPLEGEQDLHPPIKNSWLIRYSLDYADSGVKEQDPDKDRFSNLDEFIGQTDPTNDKSLPPYYTKLFLKEFVPVPFRLKFNGSPDSGQTFTINSKDLKGTQFLKLGDAIKGAPYKLLSYQEKKTTGEMEKDISELTIQNTETGQKLVLVFGKEANDPTSFAKFSYLYDGSEMTVKKEDEFVLKPDVEKKYKLIDISAQEARIQDIVSGEMVTIRRQE